MKEERATVVLTIDDEKSIRESFRHFLEDYDYEVLEAENGRVGLEVFEREEPDLVLVDLRMPELDGLEVLARVRAVAPDTPIIVVSGTGVITDAVEALRLGAWNYLLKPVQDLSVLLHAVEQALERARLIKENRAYQEHLEDQVAERTRDLERANEALKESLDETAEARDWVNAILRSAADGLIVTDLENRVTLMNLAAEKILGRKLSQLVGEQIDRIVADRSLGEHLRSTLAGACDPPAIEIALPSPEGDRVSHFQARTSTLSHGRRRWGLITCLRDVTREREIDQLKNEFISTAAHELSTPLASIMGYAELLLNSEELGLSEPEQKAEFLATIVEKSEALGTLIDELLDLSRIESGRAFFLEKAPCRLDRVIASLAEQYRRKFPGYKFEVALSGDEIELLVDKKKIVQILENLLGNAVKYSPGGSAVRIGGRVEKERYLICVEDQGVGMTQEQTARIFEKFYRADASNTAVGGLGLGMTIVKRLTEAHGGKIKVESEAGVGTQVTVALPLKNPDEGAT